MNDPRPAPRIKDPKLLEALKFEYDACEISGLTSNLHLHHVVLKSQGGDDIRANILCVIGAIHDLYHGGDPRTREQVAWWVFMRRPDTWQYLADKLGVGGRTEWLRRHVYD